MEGGRRRGEGRGTGGGWGTIKKKGSSCLTQPSEAVQKIEPENKRYCLMLTEELHATLFVGCTSRCCTLRYTCCELSRS